MFPRIHRKLSFCSLKTDHVLTYSQDDLGTDSLFCRNSQSVYVFGVVKRPSSVSFQLFVNSLGSECQCLSGRCKEAAVMLEEGGKETLLKDWLKRKIVQWVMQKFSFVTEQDRNVFRESQRSKESVFHCVC